MPSEVSTEACPVHQKTIELLKGIFPAEVVEDALRDGTLKEIVDKTGEPNNDRNSIKN